jgi:small GTP-binding protein
MTSAVTGRPKDRNIIRFPKSLYPECSPYRQVDFSPGVRDASSQLTGKKSQQHSSAVTTKAVIVGDSAVGKTSLLLRFCHETFQKDYKATIGVDFEVETFTVLSVPFTLQLWDTAGAERFKCIAASYYRGANVIVIVFDMSNINTLRSVRQWRDEACHNAQTESAQQLVFLVGTKKDLLCESAFHQVDQQGLAMASELKAEYWSLSSLTGANVNEFFFRVVALSFDISMSHELVTMRDRPKKAIGDGQDKRITVRQSTREEEDAWQRMKSKISCCHS